MSQRVKRPNRSEDGSVPVKRRKRTQAEEEEAASLAGGSWQPRSSDLKSIYNRTTTEAPAELFRKDLISAMKLPDSEPLASDEYWVIVDQWKQEWERGVQVPVNPDSLPEPLVTIDRSTSYRPHHEFRLHKNKYIRITKDENFKPEEHVLSNAPAKSEAACSYDLDECDMAWLKILNSERASAGLGPVYEEQLERVIERLELCCWDKIQAILRNEEGLGIEYDENVICDVCRSPDSEEGNEMVFCDSCNICVHQACYGITRIPEGQWLCCTCNIGKRPECVLCPNKGGAMKCLRTGQKWAHVSCALWIPEVSIGCVEKMEPITKVSSIPQSRWALICVLCRERVGACIQCSVKTCKTAYHVTCAFKHGLEMRAIIEDENADDGVKLRSYCEKHSKSSKKEKSICSGSGEDDDFKRKKRKDMTSEEKNQARAVRLQEIEAEFFKHVTVKDSSIHFNLDNDALQYIYNYWKLKRKAGFNKPLLPPKSEDVDMLSHKREQADLEKMKMFVQLRQDLERVRNLCYMVSRREKLSRTFFRMREQTFHKQTSVLESVHSLPSTVVEAVIEANHGPSIYDRLYSHNEAENTTDFETILARIAGIKSPTNSEDESKTEINNVLFKDVKNNPYKKVYFNGSSKKRSLYGSSLSSASSGDEKPKDNKENRLHSTSEDERTSIPTFSKKKTTPQKQNNISKALERRRDKKHPLSQNKLDSSSEEEDKPSKAWGTSRLGQVDKELGESCSDSDELMPIPSPQKGDNNKSAKPISSIYSDTESSDECTKNDDKSSSTTNDSQSKLRTKASVKEFSHKPSQSKNADKSSPENNKKKLKNQDVIKKPSTKKKDYVPSDLIVPQREAAKKATENLKTSTTSRAKEVPIAAEEPATKSDDKIKQKPKAKPCKDVKEMSTKEDDRPKEKDTKEVKEKEVKEMKEKEPKEVKEKEPKEVKEKKKENRPSPDVYEMDKEADKAETQEPFSYVPQRQAAKKAAEHIKSGLGKPVNATAEATPQEADKVKNKKEVDVKKGELKKEPEPSKPAKEPENKRKSSTNSTSSSSSSTSSSSDSSSSSSSGSEEEEEEEEPVKPPQSRTESLFPAREPIKRSTAKDWPFLDKGPRPAATSGSSSSSDSSAPSSPRKPSPPPPSQSKADSPSRAATDQPQSTKQPSTRKSPPDKKQHAPTHKREEQSVRSRGRGGRTPRGRARKPSNSGDRVGDADVGHRDMSDGQRVSVETERGKGRSRRQASRDNVEGAREKEITESKLLSPVGKTDKKVKESEEQQASKLEKEIAERKAEKDRSTRTKSSTLDRLFGTPEKNREDKVEKVKKVEKQEQFEKTMKPDDTEKSDSKDKLDKPDKSRRDISKSFEKQTKYKEKPIIAPEKLTIPEKTSTDKPIQQSEIASTHEDRSKVMDKQIKQKQKLTRPAADDVSNQKTPSAKSLPIQDEALITLGRVTESVEETSKNIDKPAKTDHIIKSPNKELKEQIESKDDKKLTNKKVPSRSKTLNDIFSNKLPSSETKENKVELKKPPTPKQPKPLDEITLADKIVDDHLQIHKANDLHNRPSDVQEVFQSSSDVAKTLLNEIEAEKKNSLKPPGLTNQVLQNRSIFSPQPHVKDAADFLDLVNLEDIGIPKDDDIKGPLTWTFSNSMIRGDTREDSARETLNLVEKLRLGLSKKSTGSEVDEATTSNEIESEQVEFAEQVVPTTQPSNDDVSQKPKDIQTVNLELKVQVTEVEQTKLFENIGKHSDQQPQPDYAYLNNTPNLGSSVSLEAHKNVVIQQHTSLTDHTAPVEGDERWVPPSANYSNVQNMDPTNYLNEPVPPMDVNYLDQYTNSDLHQEHLKKQSILSALSPQLDIRLHEEPLKNNSPSLQERIDTRISQTPLNDPVSMDCMPSPMPYTHPADKWADYKVMPKQRSSSSSASSSTSSGSRRDEEEVRAHDVRTVNHSSLDMAYLPSQIPPPFPSNPMDNFGGFSDASCYPVSLFPPPNLNTQLPFPPTGPAAMFPPAFGAPFPTPHSIPPLPKPVDESIPFSSTCTATFTSTEQNMAFTAAMVNLPAPTSKQFEQQLEEQLLATVSSEQPACSQPSLMPVTSADEILPSPAISNTTPTGNSALPSPSTSLKSNSSAGKKSPSKPTRTSARVTSQLQNKSPAKSPGKSPRQESALKQSGPGRGKGDSKRGSGKSSVSRGTNALRGRGRGRGRGRASYTNDFDFISSGTSYNKLVGTVYEFGDDNSNDNMTDLKSMRERRKSVDIHERKFEPFSSTKNSPRSPKFSSPSQASHKIRCYNTDLRELRPPTPIEDGRSKIEISLANNEPPQVFPDVTPPLPGPVDMRTYNSNFDHQPSYNEHNLLSAFASGTTETQVQDIDEDFEKELHTALTTKKPAVETPAAETSSNIKVSLSDSRNQLKVKIKGPIANYTSTVVPLPPTVEPIVVSNVNSITNNVINSASVGMSSSGPSSLRRMRKKELLRQYWTQDMNMDDPPSNPVPAAPPINRTIITIPKAVASMTSIPTKEDYRDYRTDPDDFVESKHHRKESKARSGGLSRELRQLELPAENDSHLERRRSIGSDNSALSSSFDSTLANKKRGRPPRPLQIQVTPKLKIKIGNSANSIVATTRTDTDKKDRIRPPKKRLAATLIKPTLEDLKKQSMKFRKKVRKDLKIKHKKKDRSEKKKRKKLKSEMQIIAQSENSTRLIIRFGKKIDSDNDKRTSGELIGSIVTTKNESRTEVKECVKEAQLPSASNSSKQSENAHDDKLPPKLTPIKLKLSRCQEGSGYMMKPAISTVEKKKDVEPGQPPPSPPPSFSLPDSVQHPPATVNIKKDCEVR